MQTVARKMQQTRAGEREKWKRPQSKRQVLRIVLKRNQKEVYLKVVFDLIRNGKRRET